MLDHSEHEKSQKLHFRFACNHRLHNLSAFDDIRRLIDEAIKRAGCCPVCRGLIIVDNTGGKIIMYSPTTARPPYKCIFSYGDLMVINNDRLFLLMTVIRFCLTVEHHENLFQPGRQV
ncbi:hypothetical protein AVEN_215548-1 [Araneus ventricosus]|uniref:Uncharacterized protein n=1 Tax=Araneus ventricosus TaxID=182803 RepID=A0A4Y2BFR0_ARAVE|nr:hypothetical protein AVEN_215548-1 [Araneus ventricosus]